MPEFAHASESAPAPVVGECEPRFVAVREEFERNFAERGEVGASVCVLLEGRAVVDLAGGYADLDRHIVWQPDTLVDYYSAGKPVLAVLLLQLIDEGLVGLDDPVATVWPEFAAGGKETVTVRQALCHRAAVPAIRQRLTNDDLWQWEVMTAALAETEVWWEPGTRHAYHPNTYGHLIGELVRRVSGEGCPERVRALAGSLGADLFIGVPVAERHRCADVVFESGGSGHSIDLDALTGDQEMEMLSYLNPPGYSSVGVVNTAEWRSASVPSTNGHGTARGLARFYNALLEPGRVLSPGLLHEATRIQSAGYCPILRDETVFGLGFKPTVPRRPFGPNEGSFGHFGTGGAVGFADPESGLAFGYVMNHVIPRWQSTRNRALIEATYSSLGS